MCFKTVTFPVLASLLSVEWDFVRAFEEHTDIRQPAWQEVVAFDCSCTQQHLWPRSLSFHSWKKTCFVLSSDATSLWSPTGQRGCMAYRAGLVQVESVMSLTSDWKKLYEAGETAFYLHTVQIWTNPNAKGYCCQSQVPTTQPTVRSFSKKWSQMLYFIVIF